MLSGRAGFYVAPIIPKIIKALAQAGHCHLSSPCQVTGLRREAEGESWGSKVSGESDSRTALLRKESLGKQASLGSLGEREAIFFSVLILPQGNVCSGICLSPTCRLRPTGLGEVGEEA